MRRIAEGWKRIRSVGRRNALEKGLDEEIRFHLDQQIDKNRRAGMSPKEARRQALVKFGGVERVKETTRDEIRPALFEDSVRDIRHGLRVLRSAPAFTAAALVTLALGIGATSAIFSVVRTVVLTPLPYEEPERIVTVWETNRGGTSRNVIAPANFVAWRERSRTLEHLGMVGPAGLAMIVNGQPDQIEGLTFSSDAFRALGVQPALGRAYTAEEDSGNAVIVLSHEFWQGRLGGRQDVLNMTLSTDDGPRTVIGVMPSRFTVVGQKADFLIPYGQTLEQLRGARGRGSSYAIARLRDGVSFDQASSEMRTIFADLEREEPQRNARRTVMVLTLQEQMVGDLRPALFALVGAVLLVLLVACVNVANLLLARSAAREREVGMRTALGAGRARLVRQMLTESLVLAAVGGVAGVAVAALCHRGLLALVGDRIPIPRLEQLSLDLPVVAFTMIVALATGIVFGLVPAFVSTSHASDALRDGGRHGGGRRLHGVLRTLVVAEVALSLVLLAGAGLLLRSFVKLQRVDPGFRAEGVLTAGVQLPATRYDVPRAGLFFRESLSRIAALPGVQHAAGASCLPVPFACIGTSFWRVDLPKPPDGQTASSQVRPITPGFFRTLGIPQLAGRDFSESDTVDSPPVAIVSEELVRQQFPEGDPLGRRLRVNFNHANGRTDMEWTIVGVVGNTRSTLDGPVRQTIFVPRTQRPGFGMTFFVRLRHGYSETSPELEERRRVGGAQDPMSLATTVTKTVHAMEPEAPVDVRTLEDVVGATIARPRAVSVLVGVFALVALLLAAVGVYGVMAYSVRERTQEIGVRMALGATAASVFRLVIGQALRLVLIGIVIGLVAAGTLTRLLERLLFEVEPLDPWTFAITAVVLLAVATVASYVPARRGMRMAPVDALRSL
jgi:putative ABC transport system permease protein